MDFVKAISAPGNKKDEILVFPEFYVKKSKDLMIRGRAFLAFWDERIGLWNKNESDVREVVDAEVEAKYKEVVKTFENSPNVKVKPLYLSNYSNKKWSEWKKYVKDLPDMFHELDSRIIFSNTDVKKEDYATKKLPYPIGKGKHDAYDELIGTLYSDVERDKLEWAIGSVIAGDSKNIQKFIVLYGEPGAGKGTVISLISDILFPGYCSTFNAKELTSSSNAFALEPFRDNPLIAFQTDSILSRIEDNTKLNSLVSHEVQLINEKHKNQYPMRINSFIFLASNNPVKITDAKSGMLRRLIDVTPTGKKIPRARYDALLNQIQFELGAIADHCLRKYQKMGKGYYDKYRPNSMMLATNDFYNFVGDNFDFFNSEEGVTLNSAWIEYKKYAEDAGFQVKYSMRVFKEELKSYFENFDERIGGRYKVYTGFRKDKFDYISVKEKEKEESAEGCEYTLKLDQTESIFDKEFADCLAQLAKEDESPDIKWAKVTTKLRSIDTRKLHYVLVPENLIVIDFDLRDEFGNKDPIANLIAASKFPPTYAEFSKSGGGIHLHYYYDGDVNELSSIIEPGIEIKKFKKNDGSRGYSSLRRKLSKCNNHPIVTITPGPGLPLKKGAKDVVSFEGLKSEKAIRTLIMRAFLKEHHGFTAPEVDLIYKTLNDAYNNGVVYDVTDLRTDIVNFAMRSHNQSAKCLDLVSKMKFKSEKEPTPEPEEIKSGIRQQLEEDTERFVFFDVEVFPNLLVICWKFDGTPRDKTVKMINPSADEVKKLFNGKLIGFNNKKYDNHIIYAASLGYSNKQLFEISHGIINSEDKEKSGKKYTFSQAYNLSYTDIYDFCFEKKSLKKWEIEMKNQGMNIEHKELGLPWDQPVPEELWDEVANYCVNDVVATEALFHYRYDDFVARQILADIAGGTVNDSTNQLTTRLIFGDEKTPNLVYTDFATGKQWLGRKTNIKEVTNPDIINIFPTYERKMLEDGQYHNIYRGVDVGKGGYVVAKEGMWTWVALLDVSSMHPTSIEMLNKLGDATKRYAALKKARVLIKHENYEEAGKMFDGKLAKYLTSKESADALSKALKYPINAEYGQSFASYENPSRDPRDVNNIIALRGALFMKTLQDAVEAQGFEVVHIKTDSIKIPNATDEIIQFVMDFGKKYGYEFEHECTYEKMCLVNDAVYIAKYDDKGIRNKHGKHAGEWTATGAQFQQPFVFKTLFSKEPIEHADLCETKATSKGLGLYLDMVEYTAENGYGEHDYHFIGKVGQFTPIKSGCGGGVLVREKDGKYDAVAGTKKDIYDKKSGEEPVYRWLESDVVEKTDKWGDVDLSYYQVLVDKAVDNISKYGDFNWFTSDDSVPPVKEDDFPSFMNIPETDEEEVPFL